MNIQNIIKKVPARRFSMAITLLIAGQATSQAQSLSAGLSGLNEATSGIVQYLPYVQNLCYAIAGCVSIIGAVGVYLQMMEEGHHIKQSIMTSVGACLFFICAASALPSFFSLGGDSSSSFRVGEEISSRRFNQWWDEEAPLSAAELIRIQNFNNEIGRYRKKVAT